jgi:hypothetical protein
MPTTTEKERILLDAVERLSRWYDYRNGRIAKSRIHASMRMRAPSISPTA